MYWNWGSGDDLVSNDSSTHNIKFHVPLHSYLCYIVHVVLIIIFIIVHHFSLFPRIIHKYQSTNHSHHNNIEYSVPGCNLPLAMTGSRQGSFLKTNPSLETVLSSLQTICQTLDKVPPKWWHDKNASEHDDDDGDVMEAAAKEDGWDHHSHNDNDDNSNSSSDEEMLILDGTPTREEDDSQPERSDKDNNHKENASDDDDATTMGSESDHANDDNE